MDPTELAQRVGTTVGGRYQLEKLLGFGGMGAVYEARNTWVGRSCAIKIMHAAGEYQADHVKRFVREAQVANRIVKQGRLHPNVVDVLDVGKDADSGAVYMVQELLRGQSLHAFARKQPQRRLPIAEALRILVPVADALATAHLAGVVHRDLKPENVFLAVASDRDAPVPKVLDFGLSLLRDARMTAKNELFGTPAYMPPESMKGSKEVDERADVWALGVMLYELVTGERPFPVDGLDLFAAIQRIARADDDALPARGAFDDRAWAVVRACLARAPADRYANGRAVLVAFEELARA
jgi:serine/threonine-protein kinase